MILWIIVVHVFRSKSISAVKMHMYYDWRLRNLAHSWYRSTILYMSKKSDPQDPRFDVRLCHLRHLTHSTIVSFSHHPLHTFINIIIIIIINIIIIIIIININININIINISQRFWQKTIHGIGPCNMSNRLIGGNNTKHPWGWELRIG